jgi:preprotein translocase subunit SecD
VCLIMAVVYGGFGMIANLAVLFNVTLLLAGMSLIQATLTLPGIAGIALTVGMAVDANVLIYERMKEEWRKKQSVPAVVDAGYSRAMATIIDSNVTTLFGTVLLYIFGTGPVRGFAVTLTMGILVSMFTSISLTRMVVIVWLRRRRRTSLPLGWWF